MLDKTSTVVLDLFKEGKPSDYIELLNKISLSYVRQKGVSKKERIEALYMVGVLQKKLVELYEARE